VTALRLGVAAVLAVVAALAALLAADVRAWRTALDGGDAVYAVSPARASWTPSTRLGGVAEAVLGVRDDVAFRRSLQLYRKAAAAHLRLDNALEVQTLRAQAADALAGPAAAVDVQRASQARTLLGLLAFRAAASGGGTSQTEAAISDLTDAVRVDPSDVTAKFDLELLLRLTAAHGTRAGSAQGSGFGKTGRRGAGGGVPGSGY
jgi:hypothetical protein